MSLSLDTVFQVVDVVRKAIDVYQRIQDGPEQMSKIGRRMQKLHKLLVNLHSHLRSNSKHALARLRKFQTEELLEIIRETRLDCDKVYELFHKWENNIGPWGLQWRFTSFGQAFFTLGTSSEKLEALAKDIEDHRRDIDQYMGFMGIVGMHDANVGIKKLQEDNAALKRQLDAIQKSLGMLQPGNTPAPAAVVSRPSGSGSTAKAPKHSPSPSPAPPLKTDHRILFVDPQNLGRSVVAATLAKLLKEWTVGTGGPWRIKDVDSAGFFVKNNSDCIDVIDSLEFSQKSYKKPMVPGGIKPNEVAVAALFDNKTYDYPFKATVKDALLSRRSKGLRRSIFKDYDFILVFTAREHDNMLALRKALLAKYGKEAAPRGGAKLLHLGRFLSSDGIPREIVDPATNKDGSKSRQNWNQKVSQIKTAIKAFLKEETKWTQPDAKAAVKVA